MKTAAAYIRVSTEDQTEYSPDSQLKIIRAYAKEHDMILPDEFIYADEGISGRKADKRPAFQQMIGTAKMKPKPFDVVLLWKFSRFARNRLESMTYKSVLKKNGIDVVSISEPIGDEPTAIIMEAMIEAMDEYYSINLSGEVKRGLEEKFSRGGVTSSPPFGYKVENGIFVPDKPNDSIVKMIYNDYLSGIGALKIAKKLNSLGIHTKQGKAFEKKSIDYILSNPVYIGKFRRSKGKSLNSTLSKDYSNFITVDAKHEPIISQDVFEKVHLKLEESQKIYGRYARQGE
ncbi:MAG: recombinase family protein, partial [Methanobrevibacter sp.]|nr:recombinase family protein [Methanobrevibacter sp.]